MEDKCKYNKYCMCQTCKYQMDKDSYNLCSGCEDCIHNDRQMHDIWACTKYERKEHLRTWTLPNTHCIPASGIAPMENEENQ